MITPYVLLAALIFHVTPVTDGGLTVRITKVEVLDSDDIQATIEFRWSTPPEKIEWRFKHREFLYLRYPGVDDFDEIEVYLPGRFRAKSQQTYTITHILEKAKSKLVPYILLRFGPMHGGWLPPSQPKHGVKVLVNQEGWDDVIAYSLHPNGAFFTFWSPLREVENFTAHCHVPAGQTPRITIVVFDSGKTSARTVERAIAKIRATAVKEKVMMELNLVLPGLKE